MPVLRNWYTFMWEKILLLLSKNRFFSIHAISSTHFLSKNFELFGVHGYKLISSSEGGKFDILYPEEYFQLGASPDSKNKTLAWLVHRFQTGL